MRTNFTTAQLTEPNLKAAEKQLRACVHCGICTATCPTYVLLGDELDGPRGRIQLIQHMLETDSTPSAKVITHIDRCLSCLACVSACPSGVNYPRLIDQARAHIEKKKSRPITRRLLRWALGQILPRRSLLRPMLKLGRLSAWLAPLLPKQLRVLAVTASKLPMARPQNPIPHMAIQGRRIALHKGCVQEVVAPQISASAMRVLRRHGFEPVVVDGCCGSLNHHLGQTAAAERHAKALVSGISALEQQAPFEAIVTTASGCGATMRDYGFQLEGQHADAAKIAARTYDVMDVLRDVPMKASLSHKGIRVAYHAPCSLVHGMKQPPAAPGILRNLGFEVFEPRDTLCCGSAGVYNVLEPEIAGQLQRRKAGSLLELKPQIIASGNIGCLAQIAAAVNVPVVHPIELVDWATGGPAPFLNSTLLPVVRPGISS